MRGIRVLDLGHRARPFTGSLLGDVGADVIEIEAPRQGDTIRMFGPHHFGATRFAEVAGRNKRSVALDLRSEKGRGVLLALATHVDVIVENFRPGRLERSGLGPDRLNTRNPGSSCCASPA